MIKVVIDTNVLVSASIAHGPSFKILNEFVIEKELVLLCYSASVINEYYKVADYKRIQKKYPAYYNAMQALLVKIEKAGELYIPEVSLNIILTDVSDNIFLDVAYAAKAHYIITVNHNDFTIRQFEGSKIVSPKLFASCTNAKFYDTAFTIH